MITKKSKVTVSKRPRLQESDLLDEFSHEYYEKMLSECQMWQTECTQQVVEDLNEVSRQYTVGLLPYMISFFAKSLLNNPGVALSQSRIIPLQSPKRLNFPKIIT